MTHQRKAVQSDRRSMLALLCTAPLFSACERQAPPDPMARAAPFVKPKERWTADHLFHFLRALPPTAMLDLKQSQGLLNPDSTAEQLLGPDEDARSVQEHLLWLSSNVLTYPFRDAASLSYHETVAWVAAKAGVPKALVATSMTFALERELHKLLFAQLWDKLTPDQRRDLLRKADPTGAIADKAAIASMGGAAALTALSGTVAFTGFAFYTTMSATIATAASAVGVTLPFAAYSGASTVVGVLSGPVGWAIAGAAALGGVILAGRPNARKTAALVAQVHALKIEALRAAKVPEHEIFSA